MKFTNSIRVGLAATVLAGASVLAFAPAGQAAETRAGGSVTIYFANGGGKKTYGPACYSVAGWKPVQSYVVNRGKVHIWGKGYDKTHHGSGGLSFRTPLKLQGLNVY